MTGTLHHKACRQGLLALIYLCVWSSGLPALAEAKRPVRLEDSIEMVKFGEDTEVIPSPDRTRFLVVTRRGNVTSNENEFTLVLFSSKSGTFADERRETLLQFTTSTENPGISAVLWKDASTILFMGTRGSSPTQVYSYDLSRRELHQLTDHPTAVRAFRSGEKGMMYLADRPQAHYLAGEDYQRGINMRDKNLSSTLTGEAVEFNSQPPADLFVRLEGGPLRQVSLPRAWFLDDHDVWTSSLSPGSRYALLTGQLFAFNDADLPHHWAAYLEAFTGKAFHATFLIDVLEGTATMITDPEAPVSVFAGRGEWLSADRYIAWDAGTPTRRSFENGSITRWVMDYSSSTIEFRIGADGRVRTTLTESPKGRSQGKQSAEFPVRVEQALDTPPRLVIEGERGAKRILWDPNPQLQNIQLGQVQEVQWTDEDGDKYVGGLFLPPAYDVRRRYPLVIQTHGWQSGRFTLDGLDSSAGYAAQVLASHGFVVAQVPDSFFTYIRDDYSKEARKGTICMEGLIDLLDERGLIDPKRLGVQAFSRTGHYARHALAFSRYKFAAAAFIDAMSSSYWSYKSNPDIPAVGMLYEEFFGGAPYGLGLRSWSERAPIFNLQKIDTAVRLVGFGPLALLSEWDWYVGLRRRHVPVDLTYFPDTAHNPVMPKEAMAVREGVVDWFRFWILGEEDAHPEKRSQYESWRRMREQRADRNQELGS